MPERRKIQGGKNMKTLVDGRNHGAGTSGSGVCSINEASCWNNKCNCYGAWVCVPNFCICNNYEKSNGYAPKTQVK